MSHDFEKAKHYFLYVEKDIFTMYFRLYEVISEKYFAVTGPVFYR